ncbi:MAG: hypothetical protein M3Y66_05065 [Actinomycetota bacterium]|nr:hypothetical protein [Actinomycetota bacterium]
MSTALSWTDPAGLGSLRTRLGRPFSDLGALLHFRACGLDARGRRRMRVGAAVVLGLTVAAAVVPAYSSGAVDGPHVGQLVAVLPSIYAGFLVLAVISAAASGGGRELIPRDQAVAWPVSPTTDHLGALLLAPLNIAWLIQAWTLVGLTSYVAGPRLLWATQVPVLLWLLVATAIGQIVAWLLEWVRRGEHGQLAIRLIVGVLGAGAVTLVITGRLSAVLDQSPTVYVFVGALSGSVAGWSYWSWTVLVLALVATATGALGALPARWAANRAPRDEHRLESGVHEPRADPLSDFRALVRTDRAGIWRSVPLRRGLLVLALMPGLIAFAGQLSWTRLTILPGLVASGAALLFGVNSWCLDGRGALWRESLPVSAGLAFASRVWVLAEVLVGAALLTVALATVRAGVPTASEVVALLGTTVVVAAQVVSASMRWSVGRPFSVDLRSARATPAPPVVMVGYSTRLALGTTMVGLIFSGLAQLPDWRFTLLVALLLVLVSAYRIARTARRWEDPATRARVVVTVAG